MALQSEGIQFFFEGFPFLSHVQIFSCEISLVCHLKYPHSFSHFCLLCIIVQFMLVLFALFLVAVISFFCSFICNLRIIMLMNRRYLPS